MMKVECIVFLCKINRSIVHMTQHQVLRDSKASRGGGLRNIEQARIGVSLGRGRIPANVSIDGDVSPEIIPTLVVTIRGRRWWQRVR